MKASIQGHSISRAALLLSRSGAWCLDVEAPGDLAFSGAVDVAIGSVTFTGQAVPATKARPGVNPWVRIAPGRGWAKELPERAYKSVAGVRRSRVLSDLATDAGETFADLSGDLATLGPFFVRLGGSTGADILEALLPDTWWVDAAGATHAQARPVAAFTGGRLESFDERNRYARLVVDDVSGLTPGATIAISSSETMTIESVRVELTEGEARAHVWGGTEERKGNAFVAFLKAFFAQRNRSNLFARSWEYRVRRYAGGFVDVAPVSKRYGLPAVNSLPLYSGVPGGFGEPKVGSSVLVSFVNGEPSRPFVACVEGPWGGSFVPATCGLDATGDVDLGDASGRVLRSGDKIAITGVQAGAGVGGGAVVVTLDPSVIGIVGPPGTGRSKVNA